MTMIEEMIARSLIKVNNLTKKRLGSTDQLTEHNMNTKNISFRRYALKGNADKEDHQHSLGRQQPTLWIEMRRENQAMFHRPKKKEG